MGCSPGWGGSWRASFGCRAGFDHVAPLPAQVFSCPLPPPPPPSQKKTILRWEEGTCSLPEQLGDWWRSRAGCSSIPPSLAAGAQKRNQIHSNQTGLFAFALLSSPSPSPHPHLFLLLVLPILFPLPLSYYQWDFYIFFFPIWATKFSPGQEQTEGRVLHFFPFHTITL